MKSNKGHIDIIEKYFIPVTAGIEVNILNTYSTLVEKGWDVDIHTSTDTLTEKNILPKSDTIKGINVKRYVYKMWGYLPKINFNKTDVVALHNFNVVPHFYILVYSLILKLLGRKKFALILTPHGGFNPEWSIFPKFVAIIKQFYHFTIGTFLINLVVDKMRAVSEWEREEIIKKGVRPEKVVVISNGIEDDAYLNVDKLASKKIKNLVKKYGRYIIQIGRVYPIKNYETTIRALALTPKDLKFLIVGPIQEDEKNKNYKMELDNLIRELNLENRVIFLGVVKGVDKYYLIKKAQMMVHMALWESFCNVVHEGLSQGLVCIVANNTALPLLIKNGINGYCVKTRNYKAVAEKINFVIKNMNTNVIIKMRETNRKIGLQDSWRAVASRMESLYQKSISSVK